MPTFSRESLELLRQRIDLAEVLRTYVTLKKSGASYKALCPFHEEKSPSFVVQKGDSHYHCYGCGAHGDAIGFLMNYSKMSFLEAVESLADRFGVHLEKSEGRAESKGPKKSDLRDTLEMASRFYHFALLHTEEGQEALCYLYNRGIDLDFIRTFQLGYAPQGLSIQKVAQEKQINAYLLKETGLVAKSGRDFFSGRMMVPIRDSIGSVIGFTARSLTEGRGPKYINTPETPLFKKSKVLFGLSYCRKNIIKERKAIIVEGQLDALRLIHSGFPLAVAGQGTAFGEDQVKELLHLGARHIFLALDADNAGEQAAIKIGDLFQKEGVEVSVTCLPKGADPDTILRNEGPDAWSSYLEKSKDYLNFVLEVSQRGVDMNSPAHKNNLVLSLAARIRAWDHPLMVHESLRKLARLTQTPESIVGVGDKEESIYIKKTASISHVEIDPDRILEMDLLRWMFLLGETTPSLIETAKKNITEKHLYSTVCRHLFAKYTKAFDEDKPRDLLSLAIELEDAEQQFFLSEILQKRINKERADTCFIETVQKILDRHWMRQREEIKSKIYSGKCSEEEVLELAKDFDTLKRAKPQAQE